jgi:uncharacterized protein YxeA
MKKILFTILVMLFSAIVFARVVGYRITTLSETKVVMIGDQNFQESEFDYQLYLVAKPAGITITPINQ